MMLQVTCRQQRRRPRGPPTIRDVARAGWRLADDRFPGGQWQPAGQGRRRASGSKRRSPRSATSRTTWRGGSAGRRPAPSALIVPDFADPFFSLILRGAEDVARRAGYRVILCNTDGDVEREDDYLRGHGGAPGGRAADRPRQRPVAAQSAAAGRSTRCPSSWSIASIPGIECDLVQGDSVGGARLFVGHLISSATVASPISPSRRRSRPRATGCRDTRRRWRRPGIRVEPDSLSRRRQRASRAVTRRRERLLTVRPSPPPSSPSTTSPPSAPSRPFASKGCDVPDDLAVVCFDDIELAALLDPFLTVMAQPAETFGTLAAQLLLERIAGRATGRRRRVVLPADLIVRRSCGAVSPTRVG